MAFRKIIQIILQFTGEISHAPRFARIVYRINTFRTSNSFADCCTFQDKFLVVRGDITNANILMAPNDQYLCIVPGQNQQGLSQVFFPFEGDRALAVILSNAFLLADNRKIIVPTILAQILVVLRTIA